MHLTEIAMAAAVTVSVGGLSYIAFNPTVLTERAESVADQATCRTVDQAIVAYTALNATPPTSVSDLRPYVRGDISDYRIVTGVAAGPGCHA